jgi:hypothetical protein
MASPLRRPVGAAQRDFIKLEDVEEYLPPFYNDRRGGSRWLRAASRQASCSVTHSILIRTNGLLAMSDASNQTH